jgi:hypothetical protein
MPLTVQKYIDLMKHALGKTPAAGHDLLDTFNDAGRAFFTYHDWLWRSAGPVEVQTVADQNWVALPADMLAIESAYIDRENANDDGAGQFLRIEQVSRDRLMQLRQIANYVQSSVLYAYFPKWQTQDSQAVSPVMRAELYPTIRVDHEPIISITYQRRWVDFTSADNLDAVVPNIPPHCEYALKMVARAFAVHIENQSEAWEDTVAVAALDRLIREDGRAQVEDGTLIGAVGQRGRRFHDHSQHNLTVDL